MNSVLYFSEYGYDIITAIAIIGISGLEIKCLPLDRRFKFN